MWNYCHCREDFLLMLWNILSCWKKQPTVSSLCGSCEFLCQCSFTLCGCYLSHSPSNGVCSVPLVSTRPYLTIVLHSNEWVWFWLNSYLAVVYSYACVYPCMYCGYRKHLMSTCKVDDFGLDDLYDPSKSWLFIINHSTILYIVGCLSNEALDVLIPHR